jgi:hypothetical protein
MTTPPKPNLDLIHRVQQARMQHDNSARPSQISGAYWVEAKRPETSAAPGPTARAGFWRLTTTLAKVDAVWETIRAATESGQLGYKAKVATASRDAHSDSREVRVMTYDHTDAADVERVHAALAALALPEGWTYHTD